ncbi:hypothetical protein [Actinoplanes sp. NPDC051851]|uniref:hypothetical protein n=1 Tax=Actinoplanes sp. NPDC051851 TaxID=3154753 RepID=UPI00343C66BC
MERRLTGWLVRLVAGVLLVVAGLSLVDRWQRTPGQLRWESAERIAEFRPECGGVPMERDEVCPGVGTADDLLRGFLAANGADAIGREYRWRRAGGWAMAGTGSLILVLLAGGVLGARRRRQQAVLEAALFPRRGPVRPVSPAAVLLPGPAPGGVPPRSDNLGGFAFWLVVAVLLTVAATVVAVLSGWWWMWGVVAVALLLVNRAVRALVDGGRARYARPRWAERHGYVYRRFDPDLVARLGLPGLRAARPYAEHLVHGALGGLPFVLFTYVHRDLSERSVCVMALPGWVPRIVVAGERPGNRLRRGSDPGWRALWPAVRGVADRDLPEPFAADGRLIWIAAAGPPPTVDRLLTGLRTVGAALAATPVRVDPVPSPTTEAA